MTSVRRIAAAAVAAALTATGCAGSGSPEMSADDAAVGANPGSSAALYLKLSNQGGTDDVLTGAFCECAAETSLHVTEDRDGIVLMVGTDGLEIHSGSSVELHPGGSHIMLEGLRDPLVAGSTLEVRLEFDESAPLTMQVPVVPLEELAERVPQQ